MGSSTENMINKEEEEEEEVEEREDNKEVEAEERMSLPGFRFHPTDEELVSFYLRRKVEKRPLDLIKQVDIYKYDPWDLPKVSTLGEKECYFFCMRGRKYRNSVRPNRVTGSGFWKATGIDKPIYAAKDPHECVGLKKSLVYYRGNAGKGTKTDWMMHEFRLPPNGKTAANLPSTVKDIAQEAEVWTLCRIFKRIQSYKKYTPDSKQNTNIKQSPTVDSCSITSSLESECIDSYANLRGNRGLEMKPVIDHRFADDRNGLFWGHINESIAQQPISYSTYPGIWNLNGEDLYNNENWDELRKVVERSIDHHQQQQSLDFDCTDNHVTY